MKTQIHVATFRPFAGKAPCAFAGRSFTRLSKVRPAQSGMRSTQ